MTQPLITQPKILAIGGAGIKIASRLKSCALSEFEFLGIDLAQTPAGFEVFGMGGGTLELLGSGGDPEVARRAAEGKMPELEMKLQGANLFFIVTGLGGGTASALAPMIAEMSAKTNAVVVALATLPFVVEGSRRMAQAREALGALRASGALVITLPNDLLSRNAPEASTSSRAMELCDDAFTQAIKGISTMLCAPGLIEFDVAALKKVFSGKNRKTFFAAGAGEGEQALNQIFNSIISCPLLESGEVARTADHLILSVKLSGNLGLKEVNTLAAQLCEKYGARGEKIISAVVEPNWPAGRMEAILIGQPDPEARKKQNVAVQTAAKTAKAAKAKMPASAQTEFGFENLADHRGMFDATEPNLYRGEDVDIPTYMRKGVKVVM